MGACTHPSMQHPAPPSCWVAPADAGLVAMQVSLASLASAVRSPMWKLPKPWRVRSGGTWATGLTLSYMITKLLKLFHFISIIFSVIFFAIVIIVNLVCNRLGVGQLDNT